MKVALNWKRVFAFGVGVYALAFAVPFLQGLTFGSLWQFYGSTLAEATANLVVTRRIVLALAVLVAYIAFLRGVPKLRLLHALGVFCTAELLDLAVNAGLGRSPAASFFWPSTVGHLVLALSAAAAGWLVARASVRREAAASGF